MKYLDDLKVKARKLKRDITALGIAYQDPRTPWYAKLAIGIVIAYALSPFDLIPDFIPILGYLDDLILLPLGIALAIKLVPTPILEEAKTRATEGAIQTSVGKWIATGAIVAVWLIIVGLVLRAFL
ncbi:YkvA family protein [Heliophilum fasciatum]|uniref:Uncharacterized membrane protein YkvA (DUF1232 family) n=1 Tax=Heliophilum fasciatum TaxID=35700 RepID=A0A4R2RKJ3_9FIRM|nr:YkvA family protein [Heliophilum fasciatum]MCW2278492.1 uncharacterized membrane protein YkvA (DUF1232 family) [Heliophilum fasciatum]TCP63623.1 uncharacterized membrane protein YkvA (DUF1232 family) [Heliophilum fasciatum]